MTSSLFIGSIAVSLSIRTYRVYLVLHTALLTVVPGGVPKHAEATFIFSGWLVGCMRAPRGICGFEWPRDCDRVSITTDKPIRQSCCFRPTMTADADHCLWHATSETAKPATVLAASAVHPPAHETSPVSQLLDGATLSGCRLRDTVPLAETALGGAEMATVDLTGADLHGAELGDANLRNATLRGANLHNAGLSEADLRGADLRNANLTDSLLWQTDLRGANLSGADLTDAFLWGADLTNADLTDTILTDAAFEDADLTGTNLDQATLWVSQ